MSIEAQLDDSGRWWVRRGGNRWTLATPDEVGQIRKRKVSEITGMSPLVSAALGSRALTTRT